MNRRTRNIRHPRSGFSKLLIGLWFFVVLLPIWPQEGDSQFSYKSENGAFMLIEGQRIVFSTPTKGNQRDIKLVLGKMIFVQSTANAKPTGGTPLYPLFQVDLKSGEHTMLDYLPLNSILSPDGLNCVYSLQESRSSEETLYIRKLGSISILGKLPLSKAIPGVPEVFGGFVVWSGKRTSDGCLVRVYSDVHSDVLIEASFTDYSFRIPD